MILANEFNDFLRDNSLWIALTFLGVVIIAFLLVLFIFLYNRNKKKKNEGPQLDNDEFILSLGGKENILSFSAKGSRLNIILKNYDIINEEKLQSLGVISVIKMTNKVTLVIDHNIEKYITALK